MKNFDSQQGYEFFMKSFENNRPISTMKNFEEFKELWQTEKSNRVLNKFDHLIFIVVYPDDLEWSFIVEKQTQTTCLQISGGTTGAGTGHRHVLCYKSEVNDILKKCEQTHAMIVCVGMVFDMTVPKTIISRFYEWSETDEYCKAHIIARPNKSAYLHHQHIELNLTQWKKHGAPDIFNKWEKYKRAPENFHDDYTPPWILIDKLPLIKNFTNQERNIKAFAYHMENRTEIQTKNWDLAVRRPYGWREKVDRSDKYFELLMNRMSEKFYAENTEGLGKLPQGKFDVIFTPTAGYSGEVFAEKLDFDGDVIFYDVCSYNIEVKQNVVGMNMSFEELKTYSKISNHEIVFSSNLPKQYVESAKLKKRLETFGSFEECRKMQEKMADNYNIEYWLFNIISADDGWGDANYNRIINKIKGKRVFFDLSNIYGYHISHATFTLDKLVDSLNYLINLLRQNSKYCFIKGKRPTKQNISNENISS